MPLPITDAASLPIEMWDHIVDQMPKPEQLRFRMVSTCFRDLKSPTKLHETKVAVLTSFFPKALSCDPEMLVRFMLTDGWSEQEIVEIADVLDTRRETRLIKDLQDAKLLDGIAVENAMFALSVFDSDERICLVAAGLIDATRAVDPKHPWENIDWSRMSASDRVAACKRIVALNMDVLIENSRGDSLPLSMAMHFEAADYCSDRPTPFADLVKIIFDSIPDVAGRKELANARNGNGLTLLHSATDAELVYLLVGYEADLHAKNSFGQTPLHSVQMADVTEALLVCGANPYLADNAGNTPLDYMHVDMHFNRSDAVWYTSAERAARWDRLSAGQENWRGK